MVNHQLSIGWTPEAEVKQKVVLDYTFKEAAEELEKFIPKADYVEKHKSILLWYLKWLKQAYLGSKLNDITSASLTTAFMKRYTGSNTSFNTARRYCKGIFNLFQQLGLQAVSGCYFCGIMLFRYERSSSLQK